MTISHLSQWAYLYGEPQCRGILKQQAEDFYVDEILGFEPDGEGQHRLLHIEKRYTNTEWLARQIAKLAGVTSRDVGYAGLKDRQALTRQWFSVDLAGRAEPDWQQLASDDITVLQCAPHGRKLRRGTLEGNRFKIRLRDLEGDIPALESRLQVIAKEGVANYFMEQRFGRNFDNLSQAQAMFNGRKVKNRHQRSLYLSAARSLLFNQILSRRIEQQLWSQCVPGDVMLLDGSHSIFGADDCDAKIELRLQQHDIHITGAMWGRGRLASSAQALELETEAVKDLDSWCQGLEQAGLKQERRSLRLIPREMTSTIDGKDLYLQFELPPGSYATAVLRELVDTKKNE